MKAEALVQEWTWISREQLEDFPQSVFYVWELTLTFAELISAWGGVLTAVMEAWRQMILSGEQGISEYWYLGGVLWGKSI